MKLGKILPYWVAITLLFSSCGVVTKARYGNGLKFNLGEWFTKDELKENQAKKKKTSSNKQAYLENIKTETLPHFYDIRTEFKESDTVARQQRDSIYHIVQNDSEVQAKDTIVNQTERGRVYEKHILAGAWMFYGGIMMGLIGGFPIYSLFTLFFILLSFAVVVFSTIGLFKINGKMKQYKGLGFAISVLVLFYMAICFLLLIVASTPPVY